MFLLSNPQSKISSIPIISDGENQQIHMQEAEKDWNVQWWQL